MGRVQHCIMIFIGGFVPQQIPVSPGIKHYLIGFP